jgi:hypothetical protein
LTKPFGQDAFSVRWYAQVRGHELVTRRDLLPDEPDHPRAQQRYYKLQLGKLVELPHPIPNAKLMQMLTPIESVSDVGNNQRWYTGS